MMDLSPCSDCRRHVSVDDAECPFCGAALAAAAPRARGPAGRLGRAAIFAGSLASSAAMACGGDAKKSDVEGPQPPVAAIDAGAIDAGANEVMGEPDAQAAARPDPELERVPDPERVPVPMPYGAPPARHRLV